ncbi:MAG: L,D-transpeptidase family protein [Actinobacteria bacterium]|nr:L,D-transpeptidase family protein [Actinomycetota bacterium]MSX82399.1 L,D-transpeptidase family protein [Actinomycetota bacterium]
MMGAPVSGRLGEPERLALMNFQYPAPLKPDAEPNRTEIDITKQVMTLYIDRQVRLITTISTGSGKNYCYTPFYKTVRVCENANTPEGRFAYTYFVNAWHRSPLGQLYKPFYFNGGIAVHGYPDVPVRPASHGCTRIPMRVADYWSTLVAKGDAVYVIGKSATTVAAPNVINPKQSALSGTRTTGGVPSVAGQPTTTTGAPTLGPVESTSTTIAPPSSSSSSSSSTTSTTEPPPPPL